MSNIHSRTCTRHHVMASLPIKRLPVDEKTLNTFIWLEIRMWFTCRHQAGNQLIALFSRSSKIITNPTGNYSLCCVDEHDVKYRKCIISHSFNKRTRNRNANASREKFHSYWNRILEQKKKTMKSKDDSETNSRIGKTFSADVVRDDGLLLR